MERIKLTVLDADYSIDKSKPCKHDRGDIDNCGMRREGSMFPYCEIGDTGGDRCPQVVITLKEYKLDNSSIE